MNVLIPCPHCDRHVRSQETSCPFCRAALPVIAAVPVSRALLRSPSRAAAFALRTALVVAPVTVACGAEGSAERDAGVRSGGARSDGAAGASAGSFAQGGAGGSPSAGSAGAVAQADEADAGLEADAGSPDAAFVPVPIYGGVFPDPMTRARV